MHYDSRRKYLSRSKEKTKDVDQRVSFKTFRDPLFRDVNLKSLFLYHLGSDFDVSICYKATPNFAKFVC